MPCGRRKGRAVSEKEQPKEPIDHLIARISYHTRSANAVSMMEILRKAIEENNRHIEAVAAFELERKRLEQVASEESTNG